MLVLTRKRGEFITLGNDVVVKVIQTSRGTVKLGIAAPADVRVLRAELAEFQTNSESHPADELGGDEVGINLNLDLHSDGETVIEFEFDPEVEVEDLLVCAGAD